MAKPPAWMKVIGWRFDGKNAIMDVRVRTWHPAFMRMMWGAIRQGLRAQGFNPNAPRLLSFTVRSLVRIALKGKA